MAWETNLLNVKMQEVWAGRQEFKAANHATKASQWVLLFFHTVSPTELPNIMVLKGIHSPEALHQWGCHLFCPWCGKEGQNEGTVVNHLWNVYYHLGLICAWCQDYFAMSVDTMRQHMTSCESLTIKDKAKEEEEESEGNNGDEDDGYLLEGT